MDGPLAGLLVLVLTVSAFACGEPDPSDDPSPETGPSPTAGRPSAADELPTPGLPPTAVSATTPETDREALVALYDATDGPNWSRSNSWLGDGPIGEWEGVTTNAEGRVSRLNLGANDLRGVIPPELGQLSNLEILALPYGYLVGGIPPGLGRLSNLEELHLGRNQLSGGIPPELGQLANLETLDLNGNQLSGAIPGELGRLTKLRKLMFNHNQLDGQIPPELARLTNLVFLSLSASQLSGEVPPELGRLANLRSLFLSRNRLSGELPPELGQLSDLELLRLESNQLVGEIPSWLGDLSRLKALGLGDNRLTGCVPAVLHDNLSENPYDLGSWPFCGIRPTPTAVFAAVAVAPVATVPPAIPVATAPATVPAATAPLAPTPRIGPSASALRIGVMQSLTGPGEVYGRLAIQAMQLAVDEINAVEGVDGRRLELVVEDSMCNAEAGAAANRRLTLEECVRIVLGSTCSGPLLEVAPLAEREGVVLFSSSATNPNVSNAERYIFRTAISDVQIGTDTANVMWADGVRSLSTMSVADVDYYTESLIRDIVSRFEMLGGRVVAKESFIKESFVAEVADYTAELEALFSANPDAVFVAGLYEAPIGRILQQVRQMGYEGHIYGDSVSVESIALEIAGDSATGMKAILKDLDQSNGMASRLVERMKDRYGLETLSWNTRWFVGSAYDTVHITAECLKQTGDGQDADGFRDCLHGITWSGAIGESYSFDENGDVVGLSHLVVSVLPPAERTEANRGYGILGPVPSTQ